MMNNNRKTAILILSHVYNKHVKLLLREIKKECASDYDVVLLCDNSKGVFNRVSDKQDFFSFTTNDLDALGYSPNGSVVYANADRLNNPYHNNFNFIPGNTILPPMFFYRRHPDYNYYWIVEYDVRFSGHWSQFFAHFLESDADLLGTTLVRYEATPNWYHWPSLDLKDRSIDPAQYLRGFFPIYRLSRQAFAQIDRDLDQGNKGHYECLLPTLLHNAGMRLEDIGGNGEFVRPQNVNRFYRNTPAAGFLAPGTFIFRPSMQRAGRESDKLWHPVKPRPCGIAATAA